MANLLTKEQAQKLSFLNDINEGFRLPDMAYIHGEDIQLMEELGANLYFSNYWYGPKESALTFAENLAAYFKKQYEAIPKDPDNYDFHGMVMFWDNDKNAMVGNINLEESLAFWTYDEGSPKELKVPRELIKILNDGNDNSPFNIDKKVLSDEEKQELFNLISPMIKVEKAKEIIQEMAEALGEFMSICKRLDSQPLYGRDASNLGVRDGTSFAPDEYEIERARDKAIDACREAKDAGLIDEIPYDLK